MRVILVSNAGWAPSGYGTQIASLIPRLKDAGHDVAVSAFFGLQGGQIEWRGIKHYPCGLQAYGNDVIPLHFRDFKADIAITLIDVWVLRPDIHKLIRFVPWTPIDHQPVPGPVLERLRNAWAILSYSKFAMRELEKVGLKSHYIPHGVEVDTFKPLPDRAVLRAKFGIKEDAFVVGMVAANQSGLPSRKGYERIMPAIANLRRQGRDDLYLYIHTNPTRDMKGVPLLEMAKVFGVDDCTYFPRPDTFLMGGIPREELAELYNCFDILAMPSTAEGFGLPQLEAEACGIPTIATDFTCHSQDTRALTSDGPKSVNEVSVGDFVWGLDGHRLVLTEVRRVICQEYSGDMVGFSNKAVNLLVTPNHRVLYRKGHRGRDSVCEEKVAAEFLRYADSTHFYLPVRGRWGGEELPDTVAVEMLIGEQGEQNTNAVHLPPHVEIRPFLRVVGWYIAEGSLGKSHSDRYNRIVISNRNPEFKSEIAEDMKRLGLRPNVTHDRVAAHCIPLARYLADEVGTSATEKRIPKGLLQLDGDLLAGLFSGMLKGDGSKQSGDKYIVYSTSSEGLRDDVVELILKLGWSPKVTVREPSCHYIGDRMVCGTVPNYAIYIRRLACGTVKGKHVSVVPYSGEVWCLETGTGNFFVERDGMFACSGNSMTELCNSGWLIQPLTLLLTPLMSFQALPDIQSIEKRIAYAYEHPEEVKAKGEQVHEFAQEYSWDRIVEDCWLPTLDVLADRIEAESGRGLVPVVKDFRPPSVEVEEIIEPDIPDTSIEDKEEQGGDS